MTTLYTTFDSTRESLQDMLRHIQAGRIQLPDFQRGWVWDDHRIRDLLASVSRAFPIGAVMMLQTGNPKVRLHPRPVQGVTLTEPVAPERLILDGQQRLTSLYQTLFSDSVVTTRDNRGHEIKRWYYIDVNKALDPAFDREDAVVALAENRVVTNFRGEVVADYSTLEQQCAAGLLSTQALLNQADLTSWQLCFLQSGPPERMMERLNLWGRISSEIIQPFQQYQMPLIQLRKETPKEAVCLVFEKVNTGGVALDAFELLTASFAADDFELRKDWERQQQKLKHHPVLRSIQKTDFLQAIALLTTWDRRRQAIQEGIAAEKAPGIACKRTHILDLSVASYQKWADRLSDALGKVARLLFSQHIFHDRDLPYRTQLVPLAAALVLLGDRFDQADVRDRLCRWFWCGVFGELYGGAGETRFAFDLPELLAWMDGGPEPRTVTDANFHPNRLLSLRTRNSAAYKGVAALLMRDGARDLRTGEPLQAQLYYEDRIDIHHIFPKRWCQLHRVAPERMDSIINKTMISAQTNRIIGGNAPSAYLATLLHRANLDRPRMDAILGSHVIGMSAMEADDFDAFFKARQIALLERIAQAMGRLPSDTAPAALPPEQPDTQLVFVDDFDDEDAG